MRRRLTVKSILKKSHKVIELLRLNNRPWQNIEVTTVEFSDKVAFLLILHDTLEFAKESIGVALMIYY